MIRRATNKDIGAMSKLFGQVLMVHHIGRPDLFKETGQKYSADKLVELIAKTEDPIFVYENDNGEILGHCFCQTIENNESSVAYAYKTLYIDDLCVDETFRGRQIGREIYEYVKRFAKENGYFNITLHAWECNPAAVGFYNHLGMKVQQYTMEEIL